MEQLNLLYFLFLALSVPGGMALGYYIRKALATRSSSEAETKARAIVEDAKAQEKEILLKAKNQAIEIIDNAKRDEQNRHRDLKKTQKRLEKRESMFDQKLLDLEKRQGSLDEQVKRVESVKQEVRDIQQQQTQRLEELAHLNQDEAKHFLLERVERDAADDLAARQRKLEDQNSEVLERKARDLLATAIQRYAGSHVAETTTSTLPIQSDDIKGRIIGKEGRNIKTIEQLTGVELIVDDTPDTILISGFNPVRRHVARRALEWLISDGRIHPARIEEAVARAKKELAKDIRKAGEDAVYEANVAGLHPKLVQTLGRLKYRTSFGQNVLRHSVEVSEIGAMIASELGANVSTVKKGGLLHDIGKAVDQEIQGPHTQIGHDIMRKFGLPEDIAYIAIAHHEDTPHTLEGVIVKVADQISGARPGARKDTYEKYVQRLEELEETAKAFQGVEKCYAIQAGREIRVFVTPEKINDVEAMTLAKDIAKKIEDELEYPGEIKVTVIRETRVIQFAR